jgi:hypothetical protein
MHRVVNTNSSRFYLDFFDGFVKTLLLFLNDGVPAHNRVVSFVERVIDLRVFEAAKAYMLIS